MRAERLRQPGFVRNRGEDPKLPGNDGPFDHASTLDPLLDAEEAGRMGRSTPLEYEAVAAGMHDWRSASLHPVLTVAQTFVLAAYALPCESRSAPTLSGASC